MQQRYVELVVKPCERKTRHELAITKALQAAIGRQIAETQYVRFLFCFTMITADFKFWF